MADREATRLAVYITVLVTLLVGFFWYVLDRRSVCEQRGGVMVYGGTCVDKNTVIHL